jgi:hypothetical protein
VSKAASPFKVGSEAAGWKVTAVEKEGAVPRYAASKGDRKGTLSYFTLRGPRGVTHAGMASRLKRGQGVSHPSLLPVDSGANGTKGFFVVLPALDRLHKLGGPPLSPPEALAAARVVAEVLAAFEAKGVAHGELDGWCVVRKADGSTGVMPPGLRLPPPGVDKLGLEVDPAYASPEVLDQRAATFASDAYSLGLVLFRFLTGKRPVSTKEPAEAFAERGRTPAPDLSKSRLPNPVKALYAKLTATDPLRRPASGAELLADIDAAAKGQQIKPRPLTVTVPQPVRLGGSFGLLLVGGLLAGGLYHVATTSLAVPAPLAEVEFPLPSESTGGGATDDGAGSEGTGDGG